MLVHSHIMKQVSVPHHHAISASCSIGKRETDSKLRHFKKKAVSLEKGKAEAISSKHIFGLLKTQLATCIFSSTSENSCYILNDQLKIQLQPCG